MASSTPNSLLIAIGNYACEKHFPETVEALIKNCVYDVEQKPRLLFELKVLTLNFKAENAEKVVKLMERINIICAEYTNTSTSFSKDLVTLTYLSKVLGVFSILKSVEPSSIDLMTLLYFRNTVDCYFPERTVSANDDNVRKYGLMRNIILKICINVIVLKQFCENELEKRWKKFEEDFCESALSLVEQGFKCIFNSEAEGKEIHEHPWWIDFQHYYSTQHESDETYKTFVEFVKDKISKDSTSFASSSEQSTRPRKRTRTNAPVKKSPSKNPRKSLPQSSRSFTPLSQCDDLNFNIERIESFADLNGRKGLMIKTTEGRTKTVDIKAAAKQNCDMVLNFLIEHIP